MAYPVQAPGTQVPKPPRCTTSAANRTYGTKKEVSNQYLHSVHKGGLDNVLKRNNTTQEETPINYVNPYDEMIKDAEKMIKQYINQYEYDIDYEFDVNSVDDINKTGSRIPL